MSWRAHKVNRTTRRSLRPSCAKRSSDTVTKQIAIGIDSVNDGELGKPNFTNYIQERLSGVEARPYQAGEDSSFSSLIRREVGRYGGYYRKMFELFPRVQRLNIVCIGDLHYAGHAPGQTGHR